jgi:vacuolar-type H+-ATPase subunit C/Vma6
MRDYADEAYLHARIYAKRSRLLSLKDYVSMAGDQEVFPEHKTDANPDPIAEEEEIFRGQIAEIMPLTEASISYTPIFVAFLRQFEALNAKCILAKAIGLKPLEQWYDISPYAILPKDLLVESTGVDVIAPFLTGTYLEIVLEDTSSYEQMETRVDLCAAKALYDSLSLLASDMKQDFLYLIARRIAITSTISAMRLKKTYQWEDERIGLYLARFHEAFNGNPWPQVRVVQEALNRHLEHLRAGSPQEPSVVDMEQYLEQYYYNWISSMFHRDFNSIYCVIGYLWLLFYQIKNIFKILEGRRFGLSQEYILGRIICNR